MGKTSVLEKGEWGLLLELLEAEGRMRLGQLTLNNIFTTGLPKEEVGRYFLF